MILFVDVEDPVNNVYDTGASDGPVLMPGTRMRFPNGSMRGEWVVLTQLRGVVLIRREVAF